MISCNGRHYQQDLILQCVRWYLAYALSYRNLEEMMDERGFPVDHRTTHRWVIDDTHQLNTSFLNMKRRVGARWRMDETYIKVRGQWKYLYRTVDKTGDTMIFYRPLNAIRKLLSVSY